MKIYKAYTDWEDFLVTAPDIVSAGVFATNKFEAIIVKERAKDVKRHEKNRDLLIADKEEIPDWLVECLDGTEDMYENYSVYKLKFVGNLKDIADLDE